MQFQFETGLVWFRRDLRTQDHAALALARARCRQVHCVFVFDRAILDALPPIDRRVEFIQASVVELDLALQTLAGHADAGLISAQGAAPALIAQWAKALGTQAVFAAHDDEAASLARDTAVQVALQTQGVAWFSVKDHVIWERREVLTQAQQPYTVFTPYKKAWLARLLAHPEALVAHDSQHAPGTLAPRPAGARQPPPSLQALGFAPSNLASLQIPTGMSGAQSQLADFVQRMDQYDASRDFPARKGPSYLGMHLRFGTVSVRRLVALAHARAMGGSEGAATWLSELIWRDFYAQILANFPHVQSASFKPAYDQIDWEDGARGQALFAAWCAGQTGYPLVDAAMAQLRHSGYMHNRLRMVAGSFLVKHLGIDWRWGERFFAQHLNDFELASNNGGWQWVSSSGCDAQPYFRIFNPVTQSEKFDAQGQFILRYLPQLAGLQGHALHAPWLAKPADLERAGVVLGKNYPAPVVEHAQARARTLLRYGVLRAPN